MQKKGGGGGRRKEGGGIECSLCLPKPDKLHWRPRIDAKKRFLTV